MHDVHVYNIHIIIAVTYFCQKFGSITAKAYKVPNLINSTPVPAIIFIIDNISI